MLRRYLRNLPRLVVCPPPPPCGAPDALPVASRRLLSHGSAPAPNSKLFVAGLSWSVDERSLRDAFASFGDVTEVRIMYDKNSGRSRGFGFVQFSNNEEAMSAKDSMDGKAFLGRPLRISFAVDKVRGLPVIVPRVSDVG